MAAVLRAARRDLRDGEVMVEVTEDIECYHLLHRLASGVSKKKTARCDEEEPP